ncbi:MAG: methyltransferase domain-containing protein [Pseudomonadota bacterium]
MHLDVQNLRNFYYRSSLGRAAQLAVRDQVRTLWPGAKGESVVGFGFAVPMLRPFLGEAARVIALMPGPQGVMHWPVGKENVSVLCEETLWPLPDESADKLLVLHGLDTSEHPAALLEECYRVLASAGQAIFIVPNRLSAWARREGTPFSYSRPFTPSQIEARLAYHGFETTRHVTALYQPPRRTRFWLNAGPLIERAGRAIPAWRGGGVLIVEVKKQIPRPTRPGLGQVISNPLKVLEGIAQPAPEPARRHPRQSAP